MSTARCRVLWEDRKPEDKRRTCHAPKTHQSEQEPSCSCARAIPMICGYTVKDILLRTPPPAIVRNALKSIAPVEHAKVVSRSRSTPIRPCAHDSKYALNSNRTRDHTRSKSVPGTAAAWKHAVAEMSTFTTKSIQACSPASTSDLSRCLKLQAESSIEFQRQVRKAFYEDETQRQRLRTGVRSRYRHSDHYRPSRVSSDLLHKRVPASDELEAAAVAVAYQVEDPESGEEHDLVDPLTQTSSGFEAVQNKFLAANQYTIESADLGELRPAEVSMVVKERFMESIETYGLDALTLGYHGTSEHNLPSILSRGLMVPGRSTGISIAHGNAHGKGIYLAEAGAHTLSKAFLKGSSKMLICGFLDTTKVAVRPDLESQTPDAACPKYARRSGILAHRQHRRPVVSAVAPQRQFGNHLIKSENADLRHVGNAYVVSRSALVAPLLIADSNGASALDSMTSDSGDINIARVNNCCNVPMLVGRQQCWNGNSGEAVWLPGEACRDRHAITVKRRLVQKLRCIERSILRREKHDGLV